MKVLDLQCQHGHVFEGWFGSHEDYAAQRASGLLTCPLCGDGEVSKMLSAPRLNLKGGQAEQPLAQTDISNEVSLDSTAQVAQGASQEAAPTRGQALAQMSPQHLQAAWMKMVRHVMAHTEDVGTQFAEEARKIHHGEAEQRSIRGQATREQTEALLEEGIDILPLPLPQGLKGPLQ